MSRARAAARRDRRALRLIEVAIAFEEPAKFGKLTAEELDKATAFMLSRVSEKAAFVEREWVEGDAALARLAVLVRTMNPPALHRKHYRRMRAEFREFGGGRVAFVRASITS